MKYIILMILMAASVFALDIESPEQGTTFARDHDLMISADNSTNISYEIDGNSTEACENCTEFEEQITLEPGNHTIIAHGENESKTIWIFIDDFTISIDYEVEDKTLEAEITADREIHLEYRLDNEDWQEACENCSEYNLSLETENGNHTLQVRGTREITKTEEIEFTVNKIGLTIHSPEEKDYQTTEILLNITTDLEAEISYVLDSVLTEACENCTSFEDELELSYGTHTIQAFAYVGEEFESKEVEFEIEHPDINLRILEPDAIETDTEIELRFRTDTNTDMNYTLDGEDFMACENCTVFNGAVELDSGNHTLEVRAYLDNVTEKETIEFEIVIDQPDDQDDNESRFDQGYNKLPQMLVSGEIDNSDLADILSENKVPPGVVNRLIKTGLLDDESIDAILEHQFNPPGILKKILGFFGWHNSYSERIYENYNLSEENEQQILQRDDLPKYAQNEVKAKLQQRVQNRAKPMSDDAFDAGKQIPPGQAKKYGQTTANQGNSGQANNNGQGQGNSGQAKGQATANQGNSGQGITGDATASQGNSAHKVPPGQAKKNGQGVSGRVPPGQAKR